MQRVFPPSCPVPRQRSAARAFVRNLIIAKSSCFAASLLLRARKSVRRRRDCQLKLESLEPRLALATGLLSTLVSAVDDQSGRSLLAPGAMAEVTEGQEVIVRVRLTVQARDSD